MTAEFVPKTVNKPYFSETSIEENRSQTINTLNSKVSGSDEYKTFVSLYRKAKRTGDVSQFLEMCKYIPGIGYQAFTQGITVTDYDHKTGKGKLHKVLPITSLK